MKSKRVGHGRMRMAVYSALLSATTLAAAGPQELSADDIAHLSSIAVPDSLQAASLDSPALHRSLVGAEGRHQVLVRLKLPSVAVGGGQVTREQVLAEQADFISQTLARVPSTNVLASVQLVLNAVILDVDAADLTEVARDLRVTRIVGVSDYERALATTVPYIGASTAHSLGATGAGVRVAVIDSGVDYTHAAFGGPGTQAAYEAAWAPIPAVGLPAIPAVPAGTGYLVIDDPATAADDGLFPSAKVVGGFDFVGETWPTPAVLNPDPDPIPAPDATTNGGHGTHVANIIGGINGVAPGVQLYAYKACSQPATSCSGVALIQSMEWSVDPNRDGNPADHVDIINMSLGSVYGQPFDDDLSAAVDAATALGVLTVASAGNSADKQFITGSPAAAATALSVAQTEVPTSTLGLMDILSPASPPTRFATFQAWAVPLTTPIEGVVFYPPAAGGKSVGCADALGANPYTAGELAGRIVLVDRGVCSFSLKIANIAAAGGILGIIGLIDASVPFSGAFGGGVQTIPAYMITLADANAIRGGATIRMSSFPLAGSLASTSSRGPRFDDSIVKPEIGAPGASVSARSGGFTATSAFGGTSGAAPMVAGAAAILKAARPELAPLDIKQILVNTANPDVSQPSVLGSVFPDQAAPITRIGGGEVRVDRALVSPAFVTDVTGDDASAAHGAVSFGFVEADLGKYRYTRKLRITNTSSKAVSYNASTTFRYQDDVDNGAVSLGLNPARISVPANGSVTIDAVLTLDATRLRNNLMNAGSLGNAIGPLTTNEYDGYIVFQGSDHRLTMPWHILPRRASNVEVKSVTALAFDPATGQTSIKLRNHGVGAAQLRSYSLLGTSPDSAEGGRGQERPNPDLRAVGVRASLVPAGSTLCGTANATFLWEFAFNTWERDANPAGTFLEVDFDIDRNGIPEFVLWNSDLSGNTTLSDGRQVSALWRLNAAGTALVSPSIVRFFVENGTNTGNTVLRVCGSDLGLTLADAGVRLVNAGFFASSWYFGGPVDSLSTTAITLSPGGEEFVAAVPSTLASRADATVTVTRFTAVPGATPNVGLMLVTNSGAAANPNGATQATETLLLPAAP